jgi:hypothetical protein
VQNRAAVRLKFVCFLPEDEAFARIFTWEASGAECFLRYKALNSVVWPALSCNADLSVSVFVYKESLLQKVICRILGNEIPWAF